MLPEEAPPERKESTTTGMVSRSSGDSEESIDTHIGRSHTRAFRRWRSVADLGLESGDYLIFDKDFSELGQNAKGQRMRERIKKVDENGNGIIEKEEFLQMLEIVIDEERGSS